MEVVATATESHLIEEAMIDNLLATKGIMIITKAEIVVASCREEATVVVEIEAVTEVDIVAEIEVEIEATEVVSAAVTEVVSAAATEVVSAAAIEAVSAALIEATISNAKTVKKEVNQVVQMTTGDDEQQPVLAPNCLNN